MHRITTLEQLDALYGEPVGAAVTKEIDYISDHYKMFIDKAPFVVMATVGPEGLDCSPRGDPAGFVRVRDKQDRADPGPARQQPGGLRCATWCAIRASRCCS